MLYSGQSINRLIHQISHQFFALCNQYLRESDLTKTQLDVLRFLYLRHEKQEKTIQRDIEKYFSTSNPTVSNILTRLENKELIHRINASNDRRIRYIELSDKAIRLYESLQDDVAILENQMIQGLDEKELAAGAAFLEKLADNLKEWKGEQNAENPCRAD